MDNKSRKELYKKIKPVKPNGTIISGYTCPICGRRLTVCQKECECGRWIDWGD